MVNYPEFTIIATIAILGVVIAGSALFRWAKRITSEALPELEKKQR